MTQFKISTRNKKDIKSYLYIFKHQNCQFIYPYSSIFWYEHLEHLRLKNLKIWILLWGLAQNLRKQRVEKGFIDIIKLWSVFTIYFYSSHDVLCCKYCLWIYYSLTNKTKLVEHRTENGFFFFNLGVEANLHLFIISLDLCIRHLFLYTFSAEVKGLKIASFESSSY